MRKRPILKDLNEADALWQSGGSVLERAGGAARAWVCPGGRVLVVLPDLRQASEFLTDRKELFHDLPAFVLNELPLTSQSLDRRPLLLERGETLRRWAREGGTLAATPGALMAPCLLGAEEMGVRRLGDREQRKKLMDWLERGGYQRADLVWSPGQYAMRGFILDVFDPGYAMPLRFEFLDDAVERITSFHPSTQRTVRDQKGDPVELDEVVLHGLTGAVSAAPVSLLPPDVRVLLCSPKKIETQALSFQWLWGELAPEAGLPPIPPWAETFNVLSGFPRLRLTDDAGDAEAELIIEALPPFRGDPGLLLRLCRELAEKGERYTLSVHTTNPRFLDREEGPFSPDSPFARLNLEMELREGSLTTGFVDHSARRAFISDRELSGISAVPQSLEERGTGQRSPLEWRDRLSEGQLVVHEDYGVGVFRGVQEVTTMGKVMDALVIEFAGGQRLLVPVLQSFRLTPLAEHESEEMQLDSLRGGRWKKNRERDRERAKEEARILMDIFARRELERRPPWEPTGELYEAFVRAFPYSETADQLRAVSEIMDDLSGPFPMDRLLVGDVGFGKTEVALRAAFRAVTGGYQVCVLVPTTILAQQHYATFQSRLAGFPVSVGLLSRFVSKKELDATLRRAAEGSVDIVIGTHKLLQKGVHFKKLGLLVIDEEHRFGVMHKEGLKRTYGTVDILSLSATPIPRTLAMALRGLRSISILSTPPADRLPVATFTGPWQPSLARKAIAYELNRGGQVYFLSNRISRMDEYREMLAAFFPEARIEIAHGQMPEKELEAVMMDFYSGRTDILVATTIIESGLDVGRANTIIIDNAEELGLAQMYQLRGRVGRRGENAFAYFFYPDKATLRHETADRLEAISTMTELGSGYAIARRDLDIRGSGEVGGTSQHGSARANSFPLFYKMLEQELSRLRGFEEKLTELSFDQGGSIPPHYVPQEGVRVTLYRRLLQTVGLDELTALMGEMEDRFGALPDEVRLLGAMTAIRNFGGRFGLEKVDVRREKTDVRGDLKELAPHLRRTGDWIALGAHAEGPGGLAGAQGLLEAMRGAQNKAVI
ncbi:MAG: DEAD/DEAH box helicase [Synergistaceae bacterium]|nr:DEAD/DEAH box helicase [Synergistaceae bacterium]